MEQQSIFSLFHQITKIPRESGKEEKIVAYLINFAKERGLSYKVDEANNVLISKVATEGREGAPTVILQSHSDMVCEKNSNSNFNFDTDPIEYQEEDGWLIAKETTLGADCGIGMAAQLYILDSSTISHGAIEALFTADEERGLIGAQALQPNFMSGKILINLDSEDEGELFIGCAGGLDTTVEFPYTPTPLTQPLNFFKVGFFGASGGHSGDEIDKGLANANQLLFRYLLQLQSVGEYHLCSVEGGNKRNAIAREAYGIIAIEEALIERSRELFNQTLLEIKGEYPKSDPNLNGLFESAPKSDSAIDRESAQKLIWAMNSAPHGVLAMSQEIEGLVESSTNLASIKIVEEGKIVIGTSQRSSIESAKHHAAAKVASNFRLAGAEAYHLNQYPGWKPSKESPILDLTVSSYRKLFNQEPIVRAIHAGLECGMFLKNFPTLDMISFGPTVKGAHAPGERVEIATVDKFMKLLIDLLESIN